MGWLDGGATIGRQWVLEARLARASVGHKTYPGSGPSGEVTPLVLPSELMITEGYKVAPGAVWTEEGERARPPLCLSYVSVWKGAD